MAVAPVGGAAAETAAGLPERARVPWRERVDEESLRRGGRSWTLTTLAHSLPFVLAACALVAFKLVLIPVALVLLLHAWVIPELYAARGAGVLRPRAATEPGLDADAQSRALLLLGDLIDDPARRLHAATGLVLERARLGVWVIGEAGALLVRPGGRRVNCYCVRVPDAELPHGDRIAHLLLALRCDERDFATVANLTFSGACWRVRRRLPRPQRQALRSASQLRRVPGRP
jgi:hypothetical protein